MHASASEYVARQASERIQALLERIQGPKVLDIGCAGGLQTARPIVESPEWVHGAIVAAFPDTIGLDLSPSKVDYLRRNGYPHTIVGDAQSFELDSRFDTIVAGELIEHLDSPGAFLRRAYSHLKPAGRLVLTTPYAQGGINVAYAWLKFPKTCSNEEHTMWLCPTTIRNLADRVGFHLSELKFVEDYPPHGEGSLYLTVRKVYPLFRRILPQRVRANVMVIVLERS